MPQHAVGLAPLIHALLDAGLGNCVIFPAQMELAKPVIIGPVPIGLDGHEPHDRERAGCATINAYYSVYDDYL